MKILNGEEEGRGCMHALRGAWCAGVPCPALLPGPRLQGKCDEADRLLNEGGHASAMWEVRREEGHACLGWRHPHYCGLASRTCTAVGAPRVLRGLQGASDIALCALCPSALP